jgi:hypothetical protein
MTLTSRPSRINAVKPRRIVIAPPAQQPPVNANANAAAAKPRADVLQTLAVNQPPHNAAARPLMQRPQLRPLCSWPRKRRSRSPTLPSLLRARRLKVKTASRSGSIRRSLAASRFTSMSTATAASPPTSSPTARLRGERSALQPGVTGEKRAGQHGTRLCRLHRCGGRLDLVAHQRQCDLELNVTKSSTANITITHSTGQTAYSGAFAVNPGNQQFTWDGHSNDGTQ